MGKRIQKVCPGYVHMGAVTEDGELWTWGKDSFGQLGHERSEFPRRVTALKDEQIVDVACGRNHTLALTAEGRVYSWGGSNDGSTGHAKKGTPIPTVISALVDKKVVRIAAGQDFSIFLTEEGEVYTCGASDYGQIGHGRGARYVTTPTKVRGMYGEKIIQVAAGQFHAAALTDEGKVYTWGFNKDGQLGHHDNFHRNTPTIVDDIKNEKVVFIACGGGHTSAKTDAKVYMFGRGRCGQLGRGNHVESIAAYRAEPVEVDFFKGQRVEQISLGADHSL